MQEPEHLGRRSIRLKGYDYAQAGGYYVTIVTLWRECLFGEVVDSGVPLRGTGVRVNALGRIVQECWDEIPVHFPHVSVDAFVVMPNHVHGIVFIHENNGRTVISPSAVGAQHAAPLPTNVKPGSLGAIVRSFKSAVTRRAGRELNIVNIWQRNYYEHILRDRADYEQKAGYILSNPSNWTEDEEYPKGAAAWRA